VSLAAPQIDDEDGRLRVMRMRERAIIAADWRGSEQDGSFGG
jgi:hypothetical protein